MAHPFETLTPDLVLDAVESIGFLSDARILALNSYENRVYQVGIEDSEPLIAKFYRPQRWTNEAILEEHQFTFELADVRDPGGCAADPQRRKPCTNTPVSVSPCSPVAAAVRRSRAISISCIASASCSDGFTRSARPSRSNTVKRWA